MAKKAVILLCLVFSLVGCRSNRYASAVEVYRDTTRVVIYDTLRFSVGETKVILEPKNEPVFSGASDLQNVLNSDNFKVKSVEVKTADLSGFVAKDEQVSKSEEKTALSEEKAAKNGNKERRSLRFVFGCIMLFVSLLFVLMVYDKIKYNDLRWTC